MIIFAHRGVSGHYPENTMSAFRAAVMNGFWIELDVTFTRDRKIAVIHDDTLDRTTNGIGPVNEMDYKLIQRLGAGYIYSRNFPNERVPLLQDVCRLIAENQNISMNIEIKSSSFERDFSREGIEKKVLDTVYEFNIKKNVIISSFQSEILNRIRKTDQEIRISYLSEKADKIDQKSILSDCEELKVFSLNLPQEEIGSELFLKAREKDIPVFVYTVNTEEEFKKVKAADVAGIFTNYPEEMKKYLN